MAALCKDTDFDIYSGNDDQILPVLSLGGAGVISVLANVIPKETHDMCKLYFDGKTKESLDIQLKYLSLANSLFIETNPIPVKTAANLMGFKCGFLRLPLCDMEPSHLQVLKQELKNHNLIK